MPSSPAPYLFLFSCGNKNRKKETEEGEVINNISCSWTHFLKIYFFQKNFFPVRPAAAPPTAQQICNCLIRFIARPELSYPPSRTPAAAATFNCLKTILPRSDLSRRPRVGRGTRKGARTRLPQPRMAVCAGDVLAFPPENVTQWQRKYRMHPLNLIIYITLRDCST